MVVDSLPNQRAGFVQRHGRRFLRAIVPLLPGLLMCACASAPSTPTTKSESRPAIEAAKVQAPSPAVPTAPTPDEALGADIRTRNALLKAARFGDLPGWTEDPFDGVWVAFQTSCRALSKRPTWQPICVRAPAQPGSATDIRRFFESEFALFRILNVDATRDGDVTGYYEPLINGSSRPEGPFLFPIYATPNDLYTIDWKTIPPDRRRDTLFVVRSGRTLVPVPERRAGAFLLDAAKFDLDTRDRNWRIQLIGDRAVPYPSRREIDALGRLDAPVLAYVDDALALYAMQIQGSGRIRLRDGSILRLQYAEQNGQPFQPVRLVSTAQARPLTRGRPDGSNEPETFEIDGGDDAAFGVATRGINRSAAATPMETSSSSASSDALVDQLLAGAQRRPPASPAIASPGVSRPKSAPATPRSTAAIATPGAIVPANQASRLAAIASDPSYVFFRIAPDQSLSSGPSGALGVPLTPGRSIAVDPRVTPLGYPVFISAPDTSGSTTLMQRLVVAQDTGGAIRGAIRADLFWGTGVDAGRLAMRTRQRGQMWLMVPKGEVEALRASGIRTRGRRSPDERPNAECLIADDRFCTESD